MSTPPEPGGRRRAVSWPVATWVVPLVPTLVLWLVVALGARSGLADRQQGGLLTGAVVAAVVGVVGLALGLLGGPRLRGLGYGLAVGGAVSAVVLVLWSLR